MEKRIQATQREEHCKSPRAVAKRYLGVGGLSVIYGLIWLCVGRGLFVDDMASTMYVSAAFLNVFAIITIALGLPLLAFGTFGLLGVRSLQP